MLEEVMTNGPSYGITIGTELAIHTLFLPESDHKLTKPISEYSGLYINLYTMVRNVLSQFNLAQLSNVHSADVVRIVLKDIALIASVSDSRVNIVYYATNLQKFKSPKYSPYVMKGYFVEYATTRKQRHVARLQKSAVKTLVRMQKVPSFPVLKIEKGNNIILTNFVMDVITNPSNTLLESHTGRPRARMDWHGKLHKVAGVDMKIFPMCAKMLMFLGTSDLFTPNTLKHLKEDLVSVAKSRRWSAVTTEQQVLSDLRNSSGIVYNNYNQVPDILQLN